jgi:hypothetical protein
VRGEGKAKTKFKGVEGAEHRVHSFGHSPREAKTKNTDRGRRITFFFLFLVPVHSFRSPTPIFLHHSHIALPNQVSSIKITMASSEFSDRQQFKSKDGTPLTSLRSHPYTADTKERYVLWSDIQHTFQGIDHLETEDEKMVLFMIDTDGELYVLLS